MGNKVLIAAAVVVLGIGVYFFVPKPQQKTTSPSQKKPAMQTATVEGYRGAVLAGKISPFLEFNTADYEKAKKEGKVIVLDFYANWCPVCRGESPDLHAGFEELNNPNVIGFRVNYKDSETDADEQALADEFSVPYQHTKIILKNGQVVVNTGEVWDKETFLKTVQKIAGS